MRWIAYAAIWIIASLVSVPLAAVAGENVQLSSPASAEQEIGTVDIFLARLSVVEPRTFTPNMSIWDKGKELRQPPSRPKGPKEIRIVGRCGSSDYFCDPPTSYCCGNSTDGFYCAADVNGC